VNQTPDKISVYHVSIISYLYPFFNPIIFLSYHAHQTGLKERSNSLIFVTLHIKDTTYYCLPTCYVNPK